MKKTLAVCLLSLLSFGLPAQSRYWQQKVKYVMDVDLDVTTNILKGKQTISYTNNSPDTLHRIFVHLYWNAFQPNSMMDVNSRASENIVLGQRNGRPSTDFDRRFHNLIINLPPEEQGYCKVVRFTCNGREQKTKLHETILEVILEKAILPKATAVFTTEFENQVPKLTRRSGRDNPEGVRFSMGQWYPKLAEYDEQGWHPDDYVRGEFYGVWGDYDVTITLDKSYKLGGTGVLQNAAEIGWGYDRDGTPLKTIPGKTRTWRFAAKNVHDFAWAADPTYKHITRKTENGPTLHFIYRENAEKEAGWQATADSCALIYPFLAKTFGPYPYPVYSFLQGSGGGTEYPMCTMVRNSGFETAVHEWCHTWYQMLMGTNESLYAWMDEGFTDYAEARILAWLRKKNFLDDAGEYPLYFSLARSNYDEPMSTHANFFTTNFAYNTNAYFKGAVFLRQLGYIIGEPAVDRLLAAYYQEWRFKHPTPNDFVRLAERVSNQQLHWYLNYMESTTKTVNYGIDSLWEVSGATHIRLRNSGEMPMPIDVKISFKDGSSEWHYIPLSLQFGEKPAESFQTPRMVYDEWKWTHPTYEINTKRKLTDIVAVEIDPTQRLADIDRRNNRIELKW
jgi:hypothetical protein